MLEPTTASFAAIDAVLPGERLGQHCLHHTTPAAAVREAEQGELEPAAKALNVVRGAKKDEPKCVPL
jgi:hypothetical protein